jgi:hypothetical protein
MAFRVIQWSTGNVGRFALRAILNHPELELVGLWVHGASKDGRDAGELCGLPLSGVRATRDIDAILALDADCICYTASAEMRPTEAIDDVCRILRSGKNVVSSSIVQLVHPLGLGPEVANQIEDACRAGKTSFFTSGVDPGFANDALPLTLSSMCERLDSIRIQEIINYATYNQPDTLFNIMGFGQPLDASPLLLIPGVLSNAWGGTIRLLAQGLGAELDEIRETHERRPAPETFDTPAGRIEKGTMAGLRFEILGIVKGRPAIVVEHVTRMSDDIAPDWPRSDGGYRVIIEGQPRMSCTLEMSDEHGDHAVGGVILTATRIVNAIPDVCRARPGMLTPLDLPLITGRGLIR